MPTSKIVAHEHRAWRLSPRTEGALGFVLWRAPPCRCQKGRSSSRVAVPPPSAHRPPVVHAWPAHCYLATHHAGGYRRTASCWRRAVSTLRRCLALGCARRARRPSRSTTSRLSSSWRCSYAAAAAFSSLVSPHLTSSHRSHHNGSSHRLDFGASQLPPAAPAAGRGDRPLTHTRAHPAATQTTAGAPLLRHDGGRAGARPTALRCRRPLRRRAAQARLRRDARGQPLLRRREPPPPHPPRRPSVWPPPPPPVSGAALPHTLGGSIIPRP